VTAGVDRLRRTVEAPGKSGDVSIFQTPAGYVQALSAPAGRAWPVASLAGADRDHAGAALAFLRDNRAALGLSKRGSDLVSRSVRRERGRSFVRFEQRFQGLRVFGAGAVVQVEPSGGVSYVLADLAHDDARLHDRAFSVTPDVDATVATSAAFDVTRAARGVSEVAADPAELMVYEPSVIGEAGPSRLVWHVRVRDGEGDVNEVVLVDATSGDVAFHYSDVKHAKNRSIYDSNNVPGSAGSLVRTEGGAASGNAQAELVFQYFGDTYDFYFGRFGRDSYNDAGGALVGRVRYCDSAGSCPMANAYWNGSEMRFGDGYAGADDVVAHELTHGVTENESNLIYWGESGAINEALSDIFGELVDLTNSSGNDGGAVRWLMGEDLPGGAIRSMSDPTIYGDPDRRLSSLWYTGSEDNRGVHFNSGVANKLAYLLTDGGSFNGQTVTALGVTEVARVFYEAQVNLLVPASDYYDLDAALVQAAKNLGWSAAAQDSLQRGRAAVEITRPTNPTTVFQDGFEGTFPGSWQVFDQGGASGTGSGTRWGRSTYRTLGGSASAWCAAGGASPSAPGTTYKPNMDTWMVYGPFSLDQAVAAWAEFDVFLDLEYPFDEIFWGVSTDGVQFDGYAVSPGPDGYSVGQTGVPGWAHELFNFKELTGVLGQPQVWFAFQFYSDEVQEYEGAYVDNFTLHKSTVSRPQSVWHPFFAVNTLETPYVGDFNGDGKTDLITFTRQNPAAFGDVYVSLSNGSAFVDKNGTPGLSDKWQDWFAINTSEQVVIGDYDGDGKDDIATWLGTTTKQVYVAISFGNGMGAERVWVNSIGFDPTDVLEAGDANGDGRADLILFARKQGKVYVALSNGTSFGTPTQWHSFFAVSTYERPRVADVTGDGRADVVTFATDSPTAFGDVYVATSDGSKFVDLNGVANSSSKWADFFAIRPTEEVRIGDLDGDGKDDFYTFLPPPFAQCYTVLSQGQSMGPNVLWREAVAPLSTDKSYVGDVNGDGKADIIIFAQSEGKVYVSLAL
jgi:Zn-dependent metalloprotease